jgi:hypothetical protein
MPAIDEIIKGRDLIPWHDLSECFKASPRGRGVSLHTLQAWMVARPFGIPCVREGRRLLFSWPEVWSWYKVHFHQGQAFP